MRFAFRWLILMLKVVFTFRKKVVYFGGTGNVNLGDNAQRMLIARWCKTNYPAHRYIEIPITMTFCRVVNLRNGVRSAILSGIMFSLLRIRQRSGDIFVTGSGYGFIDHASTWIAYARLSISCKKTPILIMPQTINFYNLWMGRYASQAISEHSRVLLCCRDFVSLRNAESLFPNSRPTAMPDIVTSLIGTRKSTSERDGVLLCIRDDFEAFYTKNDMEAFKRRLECRVETRDTSLMVSPEDMDAHRECYINEFIEYMASFKVVVTDRYHGTIFSLVANTPVIVLNSNDHKLSSGVEWFPKSFSGHVRFAQTLDQAYEMVKEFLLRKDFPVLPTYFKDSYWDKLKGRVDEALFN